MKPIDIVIVALAALAVAGVIVWRIIRKKQGKVGCDCGCSGNCGSCSACPSRAETQNPQKK